jgi:uncharacterized membrane protein YgcG
MRARRTCVLLILATCVLGGCGLTIPRVSEVGDADYPGQSNPLTPPVSATAQIEFEIKKRIYCELRDAVAAANHFPITESDYLGGPQTIKYRSLFPPGWLATIALMLQIDESAALNPGVSVTQIMPNAVQVFGVQNTVTTAQSFTLGLGATLSSTATRIDKFNPQYSIAFLSKPQTKDIVCNPGNDPFVRIGWKTPNSSPFLIESDLGIKEWLLGALLVNDLLPSDVAPPKAGTPLKPNKGAGGGGGGSGSSSSGRSGGGSSSSHGGGGSNSGGGGSAVKADTISYEIKFVIVSNGNITPTWKLMKFSANTGSSPLFALGRTRTHDLIITIGPNTTATDNSNLASQISTGVASQNKASLTGN